MSLPFFFPFFSVPFLLNSFFVVPFRGTVICSPFLFLWRPLTQPFFNLTNKDSVFSEPFPDLCQSSQMNEQPPAPLLSRPSGLFPLCCAGRYTSPPLHYYKDFFVHSFVVSLAGPVTEYCALSSLCVSNNLFYPPPPSLVHPLLERVSCSRMTLLIGFPVTQKQTVTRLRH